MSKVDIIEMLIDEDMNIQHLRFDLPREDNQPGIYFYRESFKGWVSSFRCGVTEEDIELFNIMKEFYGDDAKFSLMSLERQTAFKLKFY